MQKDQSEISIVYFDEYVVVVDKPEDLLSVPGRGEDKWDCLVHRLQKRFPTSRIIHRLDCATSGLMVLALNADIHRELSRQFHDREVDKCYEALVFGRLEQKEGSIEQPLIADWPNRPRQKICWETGKKALTHFEHISYEERDNDIELTRIKLKPITGRSHQLRVHTQFLGHPIIGDNLYATDVALRCSERLCLHASMLSFVHPISSERLEFNLNAPF